MEESRVLGGDSGFHADGNLGSLGDVDGVRVLMANDGVDGDGENEVKVEEVEVRGVEDVEVSPEVSVVGSSDAQSKERKDDVELVVEEKVMHKIVCKDEGSKEEGRDSDFQVLLGKEDIDNDADDEIEARSLKVLDSRFEIGDMVWGKVKSHPWWPGHLFNEAFATSSVRRTRRHGHVLVAFFGDSSYGWFDPTELVPFDPHYAEKAEQTTSRNFVRAVEECVDEASRRSALGLSCCCRNSSNFRQTSVPGYVAADVVDYEPGAVYSLSQIRKARESFRPFNTLSFIKHLAVAPMGGECKNLDFIKNKATTLAYRRSIFEENDETYAQAFNQQPVRAPQGLLDKQPTRAPLSGPLVVADTLGGRKNSTKVTKPKQSKKDQYLFKRRDTAGDLSTTQTAQGHEIPSSSPACEDATSDAIHDVSNNELGGASCTKDQVATSSHAGPTKDASITGIDAVAPFGSQVSTPVLTSDIGNVHDKAPEGHLEIKDGMKKKKVPKRPVVEHSFEKSDRPEKKIKKVKIKDGKRNIGHGEKVSVLSGRAVKPVRMPTEIGEPFREDSETSQCRKDNEAINSEPSQVGLASLGLGGNEAYLLQVLADLRNLALNPVHATERNGPAFTRKFFLKFRSLFYLKSSSAPVLAEYEPGEARPMKSISSEFSNKPGSEGGKAASFPKPPKFLSKHEDLAKVRKRILSERQEENAAKKAQKITEVKSLNTEKRALLKNPDIQQRLEWKPKMGAAQNTISKPMFKSEQQEKKADRPPKVEEPTYLIMKFQPGSTLPSLVELKARFARFGPLDVKLSRVFYTTNTCRVAFLYKQHANVAYRHAMGSKSVFSNVKFLLKPVAAPEAPQANSGKAEDVQSESAVIQDAPVGPVPDARRVGPTLNPQQSAPQLKSCLKKSSGGDETGGGNARTARMRFNMIEVKGGSTDNKGGLQGPMTESRISMLSPNESPLPSPSSSVAIDISNQRLPVSSNPLQPPLTPLLQFGRAPVNHQFHDHMLELTQTNLHDNIPKIISPLALPENQAPRPPPPSPPTAAAVFPTKDISQPMMSLLTRCHDLVTNVQSFLGYVPYHPL